jgi:AcrR family transcriptional regulator
VHVANGDTRVASGATQRYIAAVGKPLTQRQDVLAAARRVFETAGYTGATIERIAEEAGVSRVTLHRRGFTKDVLLAELVGQATEAYRDAMWPALVADGSGADRLALVLEALCSVAEEQMALLVALRAQSDGIFHREDDDEGLTRSIFTEPLEKVLRDGASDGSLRETDATATATVLFNLVGWTYIHLRTGHGWPPDRARSSTLEIALHGLVDRP